MQYYVMWFDLNHSNFKDTLCFIKTYLGGQALRIDVNTTQHDFPGGGNDQKEIRISVSLDVKTTFLPHPMSLLCRKHITIWVCIGTSTVKMSLSTVKSGYERGRWHMGVDDSWSRQGDRRKTCLPFTRWPDSSGHVTDACVTVMCHCDALRVFVNSGQVCQLSL